ncbi:glycosyltransferase [Tieghemostelium lacteum]|uniref:Glycosyltransferase n=1 Tax=Tieghemostelium lacteum TaxID=361077 RepID=A0A151ZKL4_TIELA|nr:glycosyltransferase [Tieghemostelium lacteum]|eukprot:KYQ94467.1 glycosyltransferase [Tieghemostelium lacteum]
MNNFKRIFIVVLLNILLLVVVSQETCEWVVDDGYFHSNQSWSCGHVPGYTDNIILNRINSTCRIELPVLNSNSLEICNNNNTLCNIHLIVSSLGSIISNHSTYKFYQLSVLTISDSQVPFSTVLNNLYFYDNSKLILDDGYVNSNNLSFHSASLIVSTNNTLSNQTIHTNFLTFNNSPITLYPNSNLYMSIGNTTTFINSTFNSLNSTINYINDESKLIYNSSIVTVNNNNIEFNNNSKLVLRDSEFSMDGDLSANVDMINSKVYVNGSVEIKKDSIVSGESIVSSHSGTIENYGVLRDNIKFNGNLTNHVGSNIVFTVYSKTNYTKLQVNGTFKINTIFLVINKDINVETDTLPLMDLITFQDSPQPDIMPRGTNNTFIDFQTGQETTAPCTVFNLHMTPTSFGLTFDLCHIPTSPPKPTQEPQSSDLSSSQQIDTDTSISKETKIGLIIGFIGLPAICIVVILVFKRKIDKIYQKKSTKPVVEVRPKISDYAAGSRARVLHSNLDF